MKDSMIDRDEVLEKLDHLLQFTGKGTEAWHIVSLAVSMIENMPGLRSTNSLSKEMVEYYDRTLLQSYQLSLHLLRGEENNATEEETHEDNADPQTDERRLDAR